MTTTTVPDTITRADAEDLLYEEAARLDDHDLDGWLELFTDDARYWLPMALEDPQNEPSLIYDDRERMGERVFRLMDTAAYAQMPPSRTQHDVTNVQVREAHEGRARVACNVVVHEVRIGDSLQVGLGEPRSFPGRCEYTLRYEGDAWLIESKTVRLINRDLPQYNLTFII